MKQMSNKKANVAISENNKLIVTRNSLKNLWTQTSHGVLRGSTFVALSIFVYTRRFEVTSL